MQNRKRKDVSKAGQSEGRAKSGLSSPVSRKPQQDYPSRQDVKSWLDEWASKGGVFKDWRDFNDWVVKDKISWSAMAIEGVVSFIAQRSAEKAQKERAEFDSKHDKEWNDMIVEQARKKERDIWQVEMMKRLVQERAERTYDSIIANSIRCEARRQEAEEIFAQLDKIEIPRRAWHKDCGYQPHCSACNEYDSIKAKHIGGKR